MQSCSHLPRVPTLRISDMWEKMRERNSCHQFVLKRSWIASVPSVVGIQSVEIRRIRRVLDLHASSLQVPSRQRSWAWRPSASISPLAAAMPCHAMPWQRGICGDRRRGPPGGTCLNVSASVTCRMTLFELGEKPIFDKRWLQSPNVSKCDNLLQKRSPVVEARGWDSCWPAKNVATFAVRWDAFHPRCGHSILVWL